MGIGITTQQRHKIVKDIEHFATRILIDNRPCRITFRPGEISVGCSDIEPEVLRYILSEYDKRFGIPLTEYVLQP